jgi:hypothetical protein
LGDDAVTLEIRSSDERHMSADTFLHLSCQVENIAQDYCVRTGCPPGEGVEALLSAAAHYALWSHQTNTFTRVADKLSSRLVSMVRDNPEFLGLNGSGKRRKTFGGEKPRKRGTRVERGRAQDASC